MGTEIIEFFRMGGYGMYVWPAYVLTIVVLAANLIAASGKKKDKKKKNASAA